MAINQKPFTSSAMKKERFQCESAKSEFIKKSNTEFQEIKRLVIPHDFRY